MLQSPYAYAINALNMGNIIAIPTEAVYGLSVDPKNLSAVEKLLALKGRDPNRGFILVASDVSQLEPYIEPLPPEIAAKLNATWPGPYTWIVPAKAKVSPLIRGMHDNIAVRVTSHPTLSGICQDFGGALISTSANPDGLPPAQNEQAVRDYFDDKLAAIVPGSLGRSAKPTQIRDAMTDAIIRIG
jgi:L-threonylcarbamoyladenylate synthase